MRKSGLGGFFQIIAVPQKEHRGHLSGEEVADPPAGNMLVPAVAAESSLHAPLQGKDVVSSAIDISVSPGSGRGGALGSFRSIAQLTPLARKICDSPKPLAL